MKKTGGWRLATGASSGADATGTLEPGRWALVRSAVDTAPASRTTAARDGASAAPTSNLRPAASHCFHCSEPLNGSTLTARIHGRDEPVCCAGCLAVAELIAGAGLDDFYRFRTAPSARPDADALEEDAWAAYERPDVADRFVTRKGELNTVALLVEGLRCAACAWLIDRVVSRMPGVRKFDINAATGRAYVEFASEALNLGQLLRTIAQLGYRPYPASDEAVAKVRQEERRSALKRLAVATFGMMQVMMFAVADYAAVLGGETMDPQLASYFRLVSLLVATPVMLYAGKPFFLNAYSNIRARTVGMDVPVSVALLLAFVASTWNTFTGIGEVYFDSITMFVFFLTLGRFVEMSARHATTAVTDALTRHLPPMAHRMHSGEVQDVPSVALSHGDVVLVRRGEIVPADGVIIEGDTSLDEALLTGESTPVRRAVGANVSAGTLNLQTPIRVRVTAIGEETLLSGIVRMLRRAQSQKPAIAQAADRAAAKFLRYVLLAAGAVCAIWLAVDPSRAFEATLAVLVVACPCAFSIAMPSALAAATGALARHGVLVTNADAVESLSRVDRVVFDKTGTLTRGEVRLQKCTQLGSVPVAECLRIATALERMSEHPIARAFADAAASSHDADTYRVTNVRVAPGRGIEGEVNGRRYRLGRADYVAELRHDNKADSVADEPFATVTLGGEREALAEFTFSDTLRDDAPAAVEVLHALGIETEILSGDVPSAVSQVAQRCGIRTFSARQSPEQKLQHVQARQASGAHVAMIGDGINDAPVLGAAHVSIAMGRGAALAHAAADIVLIAEHMTALPRAIETARRTMRIARQNLAWAAGYNFCALPIAALGLVPPWAAALGMSLSSIAVIMNARRAARATKDAGSGNGTRRGTGAAGAAGSRHSALTRHAAAATARSTAAVARQNALASAATPQPPAT